MEKFIVIISGETNDVIKINFEKSEQFEKWLQVVINSRKPNQISVPQMNIHHHAP